MKYQPNTRTVQRNTRQRENHRLLAVVGAPIRALLNGPFDAWATGKYVTNPTWDAALAETNRRNDLYDQLVPEKKWGVS